MYKLNRKFSNDPHIAYDAIDPVCITIQAVSGWSLLRITQIMESFTLSILYRMKRKKIYYAPGMISLIGLPLLVWIFLLPRHREQHWIYPRPLRLAIPSDTKATSSMRYFSKYSFLRGIQRKKIIEVDLNEAWPSAYDSLLRSQKKSLIIQKISELQFFHDTTVVLKVDFGDNNTYGDFIWMLTLANRFMVRYYAFFDDSFYLLGNPRAAPTPKDSAAKPDPPEIYL